MDRSECKAIVEREIVGLMERLGIPHWRLVITYGPVTNRRIAAGHRGLAECIRNAPYDRATIVIDPEEHDDEAEVIKSLRHELMHVVLAPFDLYREFVSSYIDANSTQDHQEDTIFEHCIEQTVINLERMYLGLADLPDKPAEKPPKPRKKGRR